MIAPEQLLSLTKNIKKCGDTVDLILKHLFGDNIDHRDLEEEYNYDYNGDYSYRDYVITEIQQELHKNKIVAVNISNSGAVIGDEPRTYDHIFLLYSFDYNIYRIESYLGQYCSRMMLDNDYFQELYHLLSLNPGKERLVYWNGLFNVHELYDNNDKLYVDISFKSA